MKFQLNMWFVPKLLVTGLLVRSILWHVNRLMVERELKSPNISHNDALPTCRLLGARRIHIYVVSILYTCRRLFSHFKTPTYANKFIVTTSYRELHKQIKMSRSGNLFHVSIFNIETASIYRFNVREWWTRFTGNRSRSDNQYQNGKCIPVSTFTSMGTDLFPVSTFLNIETRYIWKYCPFRQCEIFRYSQLHWRDAAFSLISKR